MENRKPSGLGALPPAHALLASPPAQELSRHLPHEAVRATVRRALDALRDDLLAGRAPADRAALTARAHALLETEAARARAPRLRRVINATGVVLHTNLGRAPLGDEVLAHVAEVSRGYATLEYDLAAGRRGHRDRLVSELCASLLGAEDALVVNNNAAAVLLTATALAVGREVVVSRGELVEIGGGFRVPDILAACGARLVEVGTTNRTRARDYEQALTERTAMLLKVHRSNFALVGFSLEPSLGELVAVARARGLPLVEDIGSGALVDTADLGLPREPRPADSLAAGVDLVMFSGDKLMGGPQAGLIAGRAALVEKLRRHPLARALRPGRLVFAALEATLRAYASGRAREAVPAVAMLGASEATLRARAEALCAAARAHAGEALAGMTLAAEPSQGRVGGGSMPTAVLPSWAACCRPAAPAEEAGAALAVLERALRERAEPPVVARVTEGALRLDVRTVADDEVLAAARGLARALAALQEWRRDTGRGDSSARRQDGQQNDGNGNGSEPTDGGEDPE